MDEKKTNHSTSNSVTICNENINDDNDGDDFEDGEIADDDEDEIHNDEDVIIVKEFKNDQIEEKNSSTKKTNELLEKIVDNNDIDLANDQKELSKIKKSKRKRDNPTEDDFASNIEQAIAAALKKDGIEPPLPKILEKRKNNFDQEKIDNKTDLTNDSGSNDEVLATNKRRLRKKQRKREREKAEKEEKHKTEKSKKLKIDLMDDLVEDDDYEMLCVRGGSPPRIAPYSTGPATKIKYYDINDTSSYESDSSIDYHSRRKKQHRNTRDNKRRGDGGRGGDNESNLNNGVCIPNIRGQCNNDDCQRSHDARAPRKLELCKFYLMECCAKKDKCSYMHSDFPCKYYYLGMECIYKQSCKFSHGKPLTENLRHILLKHIETAPKEILGPFKRISRENSVNLLLKQHEKLCTEYGTENTITQAQIQQMLIIQKQNYNNNQSNTNTNNNSNINNNANMGMYDSQGPIAMDSGMTQSGPNQSSASEIPSLLDMVIRPPTLDDSGDQHGQNQHQSLRQRKSRWADNSTNNKSISQHLLSLQKKLTALNPVPIQNVNNANSGSSSSNMNSNKFILNLRMLSNILNQEQIEKLESLGVQNLEQLSQLNLLQLNQIGLTANQINEIQLNALNMEKLGMFQATAPISDTKGYSTDVESIDSEKIETLNEIDDIDENKEVATLTKTPFIVNALKAATTDVDMRFLPSTTQTSSVTRSETKTSSSASFTTAGSGSNLKSSSAVDYSQYLKDSNLDYGSIERNDFPDDDENLVIEDEEPELRIDESWGQPQDSETDTNRRDNDGDVTPTPKTRDFGDDENSSSSQDDSNMNQLKLPPVIYDPITLLNNNSKKKIIDLSSTVTNMLQAEAKAAEEQFSYQAATLQNRNQNKQLPTQDQDDRPTKLCDLVSNDIDEKINMNLNTFYSDFRDPRKSKPLELQQSPKLSRQRSISPIKSPTCELPLYERPSIYDGNLDNDSSNTPESPTSTSLKGDKDMRMSTFMDSVTSDIDLRLPFKSIMDNYIPATEIDGSLGSHSPIQYRVQIIDIPKATYKEIRRSIPANEKTLDPRLRRIFCLKELPKRNQIGSSSTKSSSSISKRKDSFDTNTPNSGQSESDSDASPYPTFSVTSSALLQQQQQQISSIQKQNDTPGAVPPSPRLDPRRKQQEKSNQSSSSITSKQAVDIPSKIDLRMLLQNSKWYKDLNSKHKIMVNQQFAIISTELKKFQQNTDPDKIFDLKFILENQILQQILTNLGIYINDQGEIKQIELNDYEQAGSSNVQSIGGIRPPLIDPSIPPPSTQPPITGMEFLRGPPPIPQRFPLGQQPPSMIHMPPPIAYSSNLPTNSNLMQLPPDLRPGLLGIAPGIGYNHASNFNSGQMDSQSGLLMNSSSGGPSIRPGMNNDCIPGGLQFDQQNFQYQQNNNQFQQQQRPMGRFNNFNNNARYPNRGQGGNNFNSNSSNFNSNFSRNGGGN